MSEEKKAAALVSDERAAFDAWAKDWWFVNCPDEPNAESAAWEGFQYALTLARAASLQPVAQPVEQTRALTDARKRLTSYMALLRAEGLPKGELVARDIEALLTAARPASGETE